MKKEDIGGWLLVFYISLIISMIGNLANIMSIIWYAFSYPIILVSVACLIGITGMMYYVILQINDRDKEVMETLVWLFRLMLVFMIVDLWAAVTVPEYPIVYKPLSFIIIWHWYFKNSERVHRTFGENSKEKIFGK